MGAAADQTCELPVVILHHILSYLSIRDAARTCVLSKWWNNAWETLPYLNFNDESFMSLSEGSKCRREIGKNKDLLEAVQRIVRSRQHIEKFSLCICPWNDEHLHLPPLYEKEEEEKSRPEISWLSFSIINYVGTTPSLREFELVNGVTWGFTCFLLPPTLLLSAKRLTSLTLNGFDLYSSWSSLDINFKCLKKLAMDFVVLDDKILKNLIMGSVSSLETLKLIGCYGLNTINLGGEFVKLKQVRVDMLMSIEVMEVYDAPELEDLYVFDCSATSNWCKFKVKNCPLLKRVYLHGDYITENVLNQLLDSSKHLQKLSINSFSSFNSFSPSGNITISHDFFRTLSLPLQIKLMNLLE